MSDIFKHIVGSAVVSLSLSTLGAVFGWVIYQFTLMSKLPSNLWVMMLSFAIGVLLAFDILHAIVARLSERERRSQ